MTHIGRREMHTRFWEGNPGKRDNFKDLCIDGRLIIRYILKEICWEGMDWTDLAKDRDKWWSVLNVVIGLQGP
jgi:hypothetical protein